MDRSLWTASCFLIILGMLLLAGGLGCRFYLGQRDSMKGRTVAKVVELLLQEPAQRERPMYYKNCYYPVFEYYAEGKLYKVTYPHGSYPSAFRINQEVKLCYNKENPQEYEIQGTNTLKIVSDALYGAGVVCILTGCIIFVIFALRG